MLYLSLVSQYDKSVISPSIIAHLWNIQDIHQTEKLPTSCINCVQVSKSYLFCGPRKSPKHI